MAPTIPIHSLKACGLPQGGRPLNTPLTKLKPKNGDDIFEQGKQEKSAYQGTPELIHEFVDKIVVYAPRYLDGKRVQLLDIYYSGVGILHELTPEEMEEAFQHHLTERNKEKTA